MTAPKSGNQLDWAQIGDLIPRLMAAHQNEPLAGNVLASCLQRPPPEGKPWLSTGPLWLLIKLCLIRKEISHVRDDEPVGVSPGLHLWPVA